MGHNERNVTCSFTYSLSRRVELSHTPNFSSCAMNLLNGCMCEHLGNGTAEIIVILDTDYLLVNESEGCHTVGDSMNFFRKESFTSKKNDTIQFSNVFSFTYFLLK
jgi:hypothetical protein